MDRRNKLTLSLIGTSALLVLALLQGCDGRSQQASVAQAKAAIDKGDHTAAILQLKAVLQLDPSSQEARVLLGKELLAASDPTAAALELGKALDAKAPAEAVLPALSKALLLAGDYKGLVGRFGEINLNDKQAQADLKSNVASGWGALGDRAKTEAALAAALAAVPEHGPSQILQARILAGSGKLKESVVLLDQVLAKEPGAYEGWLLRGEILQVTAGNATAAEESFAKALAVRKDFLPAHAAIIASRLQRRDVAGAKAQAAALRAVVPRHPLTALVDAQLAFVDKQYLKSRELLQGLLRVLPEHLSILLLAGVVEGELGATVQASAHFGKALQLNPSSTLARRNLADAQLRLGDYANAMQTLKPMLAMNPPSADVLSLAGDAELRMGNPAAAEKYFMQAARQEPGNERIQTVAAVAKVWGGDAVGGLAELQTLAERSKDTLVDEALFATRMKRREYDKALATLDAMAKKAPGKARHLELRGMVQVARKDFAAARDAYEAALKQDPALFGPVASLAEIDVRENKPQQAIERLEASLKANPKNALALVILASIKDRRGAPVADVQALLAQAVAGSPMTLEPRLQQIDFLLRKRLFKDAKAAAQEALAAFPNEPPIIEAVGRAQMLAGDIEQAANTFRKLASLQPNSPQAYMNLADLYTKTGKRDQAEAALNKALEIDPNLNSAQAALLEIMMSSNRQRDALEYIRRIKQRQPGVMTGYSMEAAYHVRQKNPEAAQAALREGLARTNNPELATRLYSLLGQSGKNAEADAFAASWLKSHPGDLGFEFLVSTLEMSRGNLASAQARLKKVLAAQPNSIPALNNMAWILTQQSSPEAITFARRALELDPERPVLMDTLAAALAANKQAAEALTLQKKALELSPSDPALRLNLARIALQVGDKTLARDELQRLEALGATFPQQAEVARLKQGL